ncbi:MAG: hypothetical protein K6D97_06910 [Clostridia bacterium]|nr:hypothetical protein [Clostridia bacterium]
MKYERYINGSSIVDAIRVLAREGIVKDFNDFFTWDKKTQEKILKSTIAHFLYERMRFAAVKSIKKSEFTRVATIGSTEIEKLVKKTVIEKGFPTSKEVPETFSYDYRVDIKVKIISADPAMGLFEMTYTIDAAYMCNNSHFKKDCVKNITLPEDVQEEYDKLEDKVEDILLNLELANFSSFASQKPVITAFYAALTDYDVPSDQGVAANSLGNIHYNAMKIVPGYASVSPITRTEIMQTVVDKVATAIGRKFEYVDTYTYAKYFFYELERRELLGELIIRPYYCPEVVRHVKLKRVIYMTRIWPEGGKESRPVHLVYTHKTKMGVKMTHWLDPFDIWMWFAGGPYKGKEE